MPDMDGFKLLEHIGLEMDLPVISPYSSSKSFSLHVPTNKFGLHINSKKVLNCSILFPQ
jgi:hypothetical protein